MESATAEELAGLRQRSGTAHQQAFYAPSVGSLPAPWPKDHQGVVARVAAVDECLLGLQALGQGQPPAGSWEEVPQDEWLGQLESTIKQLADAGSFQAGAPHQAYEVWRHFFRKAGELLGEALLQRKQVKWLLRLLRRGIEPDWVPGTAAGQFESKLHEARLVRLGRELEQLGLGGQLADFLEGKELVPVQFPNSRKLDGLETFMAETRDKLLAVGALEGTGGRRPRWVHRLTVEDKKAKLRLCVDALPANIRSRVEKFSYERLGDMRHYLMPLDYMFTTDFRSGYHHFLLSPQYWTYFGVEILGEYYVFKALVFGWSPACKIFTDIMGEVYRVLRLLSAARMTFLIDDQITACGPDLRLAKARSRLTATLLAALRMYMGLEKCQLLPQRQAITLGMQVETDFKDVDGATYCRFLLPAGKLLQLEAAGTKLLRAQDWTPRLVASFGGQLVFGYEALRLAPLLVREVHMALAGHQGWDAVLPPDELSKQRIAFVLEYARSYNGKRLFKRPVTLVVAADYSSVHGHGAFVVDGSEGEECRLLVALTPEELEAARQHHLSSTAGELLAKEQVMQWISDAPSLRQRAQHGHVLFEGDNQAAEAVLEKLGGNATNFPIVARIHRLAAELDCDVSTAWAPRETANQVEADRLSKLRDDGDWVLLAGVGAGILAHPLLGGRQPTLDPFASSLSKMAPCGYTKAGCPGSNGVDGMRRSWQVTGPAGERPLVWVYPDFGSMGAVVGKLLQEQQDSILVYPDWPRVWRGTMMVPQRRADWELGRVMAVSRPTSRTAVSLQQLWQAAQQGSTQGPQYKLRCAVFLFS